MTMAKFKVGAALVAAVILIILVFQNTGPVETRLLFTTIAMPHAALVALTLLIGIIGGIFIALTLSARRGKKVESFEQKDAINK